MFTITVGDLREQNLHQALRQLSGCRSMDLKGTLKIASIMKELKPHFAKIDQDFTGLVKQYATTKEDANGNGMFNVPKENLAIWETEYNKFVGREITIRSPEISLNDISKAGLSPSEVMALEPMMDQAIEEAHASPTLFEAPPMSMTNGAL